MNEVEKVAAAIRRHHVTRTLYTGPGKTKARRLHSGDLEAAQAAAAIIAADRAELVERVKVLEGVLADMLHAVCHETGFAAAVRADSGLAYPWEPLDMAEAKARAALKDTSHDRRS